MTTQTTTLYAGRRRRNVIMMGACLCRDRCSAWAGSSLILAVLLWEGFSGLSLAVFTEMTPPPGGAGGLLNPIVGSLIMTVLGGRSSARRSASWPAPTWPNTAATSS